jgi:hypothetical protein
MLTNDANEKLKADTLKNQLNVSFNNEANFPHEGNLSPGTQAAQAAAAGAAMLYVMGNAWILFADGESPQLGARRSERLRACLAGRGRGVWN